MAKNELDVLSEILLEVYRASAESALEQFQDRALEAIKTAVPFDACMWGTATFDKGLDIHSIHLHNKSPQMLIDYDPFKHLDTAAAAMAGRQRATMGFHVPTWNNGKEYAGLREVLRKHEQQNLFITSRTELQTGFTQWLTLFRRDPDDQCRPEEVALVANLGPHLMQALGQSRSRHLDRLRAGEGSAREALIADARGVIYHATPGCDALLRAEWPSWRGVLPQPLRDMAASGGGVFTGAALVADSRIERDLLFVRLRARAPIDALSPREREVATWMASGLSHKEVAQRLGRAPATVRNQLQSAYRKLGVQSIGALAEVLRQG